MKPYKNPRKIGLHVFMLAVALLVAACQENVDLQQANVPIAEQSYDQQVVYAQANLKVLAKSALNIAHDPKFREIVYQEVEKQFDGNYNVLFDQLTKINLSDKKTIGARMAESLGNAKKLTGAMEAFKGIEGDDYYPQIYIPFYDNLKAKKNHGNTRVLTTTNDPVVVIFTGDDAQDIYPGYQLDKESGALNTTDFMVDETYAQNNEVWVVSLNEQVEQNFVQGGGGGGAGGGGSSPTPGAVVDQIKCKCHKESWAAGASEVHIITITADYRFFNVDVNLYGKGENEGGQIYKFSRKDVNREWNKNVNFYIVNYCRPSKFEIA